MNITISSILVTLISSTLLITLLNYVISYKKNYKKLRIDFLSILLLIIVCRLCFPIESFYTITIEAPIIMNPITEILNISILDNFLIYQILLVVWLIGCIVKFIKIQTQIKISNHFLNYIMIRGERKDITDFLPDYVGKNYPVYVSELVSTPMVLLFKKVILLPSVEYTKYELTFILYHEITHLNNHDALIKRFMHFLSIIYWWFPLIYIFEKQVNLFLELRVDSKVTRKMSRTDNLKYIGSLVSVKRKSLKLSSFPFSQVSSFVIKENRDFLKCRIEYFLEGNFKEGSKKTLLFSLIFLFILSNLVIFEPSYPLNDSYDISESSDFDYILHKKDGTYNLIHKNGEDLGIISDISATEFRGLKIKEE